MPWKTSRFTKRISCCLFVYLALMVFIQSGISCSPGVNEHTADTSSETLSVFANIPPQAYMIKKVGRQRVDVNVLVPPGSDPHMFSPNPRQVMKLGASDIYFHGIMPFGKELARRVAGSGAPTLIADITENITLRHIEHHCHNHDDGHSHDNGHCEHEHHNGMDPHVWLSPPEIKIQARNIAKHLKSADPDKSDYYRENLNEFLSEVDAAHEELKNTLAPYQGRTFFVFHPAFGYFARTYGLNQQAVETGGKSPAPKQLRTLIHRAQEDNVKVIFVQPQFESRSAATIAEAIDGVVVPLDPLAYDVLENLRTIAEKIEDALREN